jgi:peptide/nickel transport system substrate-binding protein
MNSRAQAMTLRARVAVVVLLVVTSACTRVSTSSQPRAASWTIPGVVRYAIPNDLNTLNPVLGGLAYENAIEAAVFDGLVKLDDHERLIPDLATEIPSLSNGGISADGKTITYHLRRGVTWQDGAPVTSADVAFTAEKIMDPTVNAPSSGPYTHIASVETPNNFTVIIHLKAPWAPAIGQLFCDGENGSIIPKHLLEHSADFNRDPFGVHPVGSGPLRLVRWDRGADLILEPNNRYFGGAPKLQKVIIQIVPDTNTRLTELTSHSLDFATIAADQADTVRRAGGLKVLLVPNYALAFVAVNVTRAPLNDARVRRALAMALDRPRLTRTVFLGTAIPADSFIPPFSWAYEPNNDSPSYDPSQAARTLDAAGWRIGNDGIRHKGAQRLAFDVVTNSGSVATMMLCEELQQAWKAVGADVSVRALPLNVLRSPTGLLVTGQFATAVLSFIFDPDPDRSQNLGSEFIGARGFNESRYVSARSDELSTIAVAVYDHAKRKPFYAQLQRLWNTDMPIIPIAWVDNVDVINSDFRGFRPEPVNSDFWNVSQWQI